LHRQLEDTLARLIKPARNRILCHNDLAAILDDSRLGGFPKHADHQYFDLFQKFLSIVQGAPFEFGSFPRSDAEILLDTLMTDLAFRSQTSPRKTKSEKSSQAKSTTHHTE
jgi:hypothetical protein